MLLWRKILSVYDCVYVCVRTCMCIDTEKYQLGFFSCYTQENVKILWAVCNFLGIVLFSTSRVIPSYKVVLEK